MAVFGKCKQNTVASVLCLAFVLLVGIANCQIQYVPAFVPIFNGSFHPGPPAGFNWTQYHSQLNKTKWGPPILNQTPWSPPSQWRPPIYNQSQWGPPPMFNKSQWAPQRPNIFNNTSGSWILRPQNTSQWIFVPHNLTFYNHPANSMFRPQNNTKFGHWALPGMHPMAPLPIGPIGWAYPHPQDPSSGYQNPPNAPSSAYGPQTNYGVPNITTADGNIFVGTVGPLDKLLYSREYVKPGRWWSSRTSILEYPSDLPLGYTHNETITAIRIFNRFLGGNFAKAEIVQGGVNQRYVKIKMESTGWGKGFRFSVSVYGH